MDKILVFLPAYNEEGKIGKAVSRIPKNLISEILVIDDGSSDATSQVAKKSGARVIRNMRNTGVGNTIRQAIHYGRENNFTIFTILAGNNKDDGSEINKLITPLLQENYDFIQGSRFIENGFYGNMPFYRLIATKYIHPFLFSFFTGKAITDSTNGFRAFKLKIIEDKRINLTQQWLNGYELEPYFLYKVVTLGYKFKEVPVCKVYPSYKIGYTKMTPIVDWWRILKPILLLGLKLKE